MRKLSESWIKLQFLYRLLILTSLIATVVILALRFIFNVTELGNIADWVVGSGLIFFALVELYLNHLNRKHDLARPHIRILIQETFPKIMHQLQETWDESTIGYFRIKNLSPDGPVELYNPANIAPQVSREERYLMRRHTPDIYERIFNYDKSIQEIRENVEKSFKQANNILYATISADQGKNTNLPISAILMHCFGLSLNVNRYLYWEKLGTSWQTEVKRVKETGWWTALQKLDKQKVEDKLKDIQILSSGLRIVLMQRYEELANEFGIEPKV